MRGSGRVMQGGGVDGLNVSRSFRKYNQSKISDYSPLQSGGGGPPPTGNGSTPPVSLNNSLVFNTVVLLLLIKSTIPDTPFFLELSINRFLY